MTVVESVPLHQVVDLLAFLLGTWRGEGRGEYPNIEDFTYGEEATFWHAGKPWIGHAQRTWSLDTGIPMHAEMGFWRPQPDGRVEIVLAHTLGIAEVQEGAIHGRHVEVSSSALAPTSSAKPVKQLVRTFDVSDDVLTYEPKMAYDNVPLQHHLGARLHQT